MSTLANVIEFVGEDGGTVILRKVVRSPGYCFEDSEWVATGSIQATYTNLKTAYGRLLKEGYVRR